MTDAAESDPVLEILWKFVRGDTRPAEFEQWVYAESGLEGRLGEAFYLELVSVDFASKKEVYEIGAALRVYLEKNHTLSCGCITLRDLADVGMGADNDWVIQTLEKRAWRGKPLWWLSANQCAVCSQHWLMASDSRINDVFLLKRLSPRDAELVVTENHWPDEFDSFEAVLQLGRDRGHNWQFFDPVDRSLVWTAADLAKERPGISVSELAKLLQVNRSQAERIARRAQEEEGAVIIFEP